MAISRGDPLTVSHPRLKGIFAKIGETGLQTILDEFYHLMSHDVLIGFYFDGKDVAAIARTQKDFLMRAMGARPSYEGKPPARAHSELAPILTGHFDRRLTILEEVLRRFAPRYGLDVEDIRTWIGFENAFRDGIVQSRP